MGAWTLAGTPSPGTPSAGASGDAASARTVAFASKHFAGLRPVADELWVLDVATGVRRRIDGACPDGAGVRIEGIEAYRGGLLCLVNDMRAHGVNQDPQPRLVSLDGAWADPFPCPDLCYGNAMSCDSSYGGGCASRVVGGSWYAVTTEFDGAYVRRIELGDPDGGCIACERVVELDGPVVSFDTADGRTFWCVAGSPAGLPEVYRVELGVAAGSEAPAREAPARVVRVTDCSRALEGRLVSPPEPFEFESNGATLTGYVIKPVGYDGAPDGGAPAGGSAARRAYPAVLEIHGGPKVAYGTQFSHEMQVLATQGYFVLFTNPHGSAGRGGDFADIRGRYGREDYADLMAFVDEALRRYPAIDPERLAVMGGSYGGFMTNWIVGHTNRFRCANSQRSIANYMTKFLVSDIGTWGQHARNHRRPRRPGIRGRQSRQGVGAVAARLCRQRRDAHAVSAFRPRLSLPARGGHADVHGARAARRSGAPRGLQRGAPRSEPDGQAPEPGAPHRGDRRLVPALAFVGEYGA